jgi:hypothetical protein
MTRSGLVRNRSVPWDSILFYARWSCVASVCRPTVSSSIARSIAASQTLISRGPRPGAAAPMCRAYASTGRRRSDRPDLPCGERDSRQWRNAIPLPMGAVGMRSSGSCDSWRKFTYDAFGCQVEQPDAHFGHPCVFGVGCPKGLVQLSAVCVVTCFVGDHRFL